ncbi:MAG TPA: hypothetical protein VIH86_05180 [Puia sp.]
MQFYPEGKTFTAGNNTRFAFSAFNEQGKPMNVSGYITDSTNAVIAKYSTTMAGVGSFILFGDEHSKYIAHTFYEAEKMLNTELPIPDAFGYQLSVTNENDDSVFMQVSLGDSVYKKYRTSYVLGFNRNNLCYAALGKDMYTFSIAKKNLPQGQTSILLLMMNKK